MFVVARPRLKRGEDMPKPGSIDLVKERHWRGIIRDWQESGLSMSAYCLREKIKLGQLSTWFKKIKARDHARKSSASSANERQFELPLDDNLRKYPKIVLGTAR
jgi:hypothetical protein